MPGVTPSGGIDAQALFAPLIDYGRLALAVSGGPDSLALLLLAHRFATQTAGHGRFIVYSVDHGLRVEAADEVAFVLRIARDLGFFARGLRWEGEKPASGIQEAARAARYRLLAEAMAADRAAVLITAHHLGDQAETVLMRLAHGSGIEGLRGMDALSDLGSLRIARPLLGTDPADLRAVVEDAGLTPVADPSNLDPGYERVRWRQVMPQLAALGLDARRIATFAGRMREAEAALAAMAAEAMSEVGFAPGDARATLSRDFLAGLPRAVAVRVLARVLDRVGGDRKPHALGAVERLADRLSAGRIATTLHGCIVRGGTRTIRISREAGRRVLAKTRQEPTDA